MAGKVGMTRGVRVCKELCSKCKCNIFSKGKYCNTCHAEYMRNWRMTHKLNDNQKRKDNTRSMTKYYIKTGKLYKGLCEICGSSNVEAHHDDYDKPLQVRWLCRKHHLEHHRNKG